MKSRFFGDYEIHSEIARGGMGVVYRARQLGLNRLVALKMVQSHHLLSDEARLRFRVEIEAVAQLNHPHIVSLYESGEQDGAHYFTMRLVEGGDLAVWLECERPLRQIIQLLVKVCRAVHHAHQRGILHRDLKPSNILVDEQGEPHVADFGLAKSLDQESGFTFTSSVLGSPNYMAPEQASGKVRQLTTAVDVYGLGAILYHVLAARPPFQAGTPIETLRQVVDHDPISPGTFKPDTDSDLETIALKCLRKAPGERYGTAEELAQDLERWLANEPILARPLGPLAMAWRWCRRKPGLAGALAVALLAVAASALFGAQARRADYARLAERRQNAIDKTLTTAWSGDLQGTEQSVRDAELAGVSVGEIRMLRGSVAMHRGDYREAVNDLEQAWKLSPNSVAVCSMLIRSHALLGQWDKGQPLLEALERLKPTTPEDYLFRGVLDLFIEPAKALETLNEAVRRRPTGVALLQRASARAGVAQDTAKKEDAEAAIADVNAAKAVLPPNAEITALSLNAHLIACGIYEEHRLPDKRADAWRQVEADAAALERYSGNEAAILGRAMYLKHLGSDPVSLRKMRATATNGIIDYLLAVALYRQGAWQSALEVVPPDANRVSSGLDFMRGFILAELPDGPQLAWNEVQRLWRLNPSTWDTMAIQLTLRLLGRKTEAINMCRKARERATPALPWRREWYQQLLDYNCGDLSEAELLKAAGAARYNQCEAHFFIGMTKMAENDRVAARNHFRASVATRVFTYFDYDWSGTFLAHMEKDPNWPPWIPLNTELR